MSFGSEGTINLDLAMWYGDDRHPTLAPAQIEVGLFNGDPSLGGTELSTAGGYARLVVDNDSTTWPTVPSGGHLISATLTWPAASADWSDTVTHWQTFNPDTGDAIDSCSFGDEADILAGVAFRGVLDVFGSLDSA